MKLTDAILCLDCDEIAPESDSCPACTSRSVIRLATWIPPLGQVPSADVRAERRRELYAEVRLMTKRMIAMMREINAAHGDDPEPLGIGA